MAQETMRMAWARMATSVLKKESSAGFYVFGDLASKRSRVATAPACIDGVLQREEAEIWLAAWRPATLQR